MAGEESGIVRKLILKPARLMALLPGLQLVVRRKKSGDFASLDYLLLFCFMPSSGMNTVFTLVTWFQFSIIESLLDWIHVLYLNVVELNYNGLELHNIDNSWWLKDEGNKNYCNYFLHHSEPACVMEQG